MTVRVVSLTVAVLLVVAGFALFGSNSAEATVDPIMSGECSNQEADDQIEANRDNPAPFPNDIQHPPGISGGSNADNVAKPLFASGVLLGFDGDGNPIIDGANPALRGDSGVENGCPGADGP